MNLRPVLRPTTYRVTRRAPTTRFSNGTRKSPRTIALANPWNAKVCARGAADFSDAMTPILDRRPVNVADAAITNAGRHQGWQAPGLARHPTSTGVER